VAKIGKVLPVEDVLGVVNLLNLYAFIKHLGKAFLVKIELITIVK